MTHLPEGNAAKNHLHIQLLGGFSVSSDAGTIPSGLWKSRRASICWSLTATE